MVRFCFSSVGKSLRASPGRSSSRRLPPPWLLSSTSPDKKQAWLSFAITLGRVALAVRLGGAVGLTLGIAAGLCPPLRWILEPLRWVSMSIPPITVVVVALLWLGMGTPLVVTFAAIMLAPIVYVNTVKGFDLIDNSLVEMTRVYRFPFFLRLRKLYIPALAAPLSAAAIQIVCNAVRVTLLAEVMGDTHGMGARIDAAGKMLDIPTLFAWILLAVIIVGILETAMLTPLQRRFVKWNEAAK